jgi:hypothetical protein
MAGIQTSHEDCDALAAPLKQPILQFGMSRFMQAHVVEYRAADIAQNHAR